MFTLFHKSAQPPAPTQKFYGSFTLQPRDKQIGFFISETVEAESPFHVLDALVARADEVHQRAKSIAKSKHAELTRDLAYTITIPPFKGDKYNYSAGGYTYLEKIVWKMGDVRFSAMQRYETRLPQRLRTTASPGNRVIFPMNQLDSVILSEEWSALAWLKRIEE